MSKVIGAAAIGNLIEAHLDKDETKFLAWANFIADAYADDGDDFAAELIRKRITGDCKNSPKAELDQLRTCRSCRHYPSEQKWPCEDCNPQYAERWEESREQNI